jgi:hypothetical protein
MLECQEEEKKEDRTQNDTPSPVLHGAIPNRALTNSGRHRATRNNNNAIL